MPALIDLRKRIKSVKNTQKITQAMKTVSTVKFQKAQRYVMQSRPHWHGYPELLEEMARWAPPALHPLLQRREEKRILGMVITSDKGLAGAFNSNLLEAAHDFFEEKAQKSDIRLVLVGKKAVLDFKKTEYPVVHSLFGEVNTLTPQDLRELSLLLMKQYVLNKTDAVYVAYNEFKSILAPLVTISRLLPVEFEGGELLTADGKADEAVGGQRPDWDPGMEAMLQAFLPLHVEKQVEHYFMESTAAEHAARMMAMDNATNNAEDLIDDLTLVMNKIRQASITKELLEIMSAVDALAKK
ncbi:ATP synthase F1 subunit gamma [Acidobacteriota bacterium]